MRWIKRFGQILLLGVVLILIVMGIYGWTIGDTEAQSSKSTGDVDRSTLISRGEYLVRAGNCIACHTARGGQYLAGGRVLQSEFGEFITPNITPDQKTGIGSWSADEFWQALHNGKGKGGKLLYPAFPYTNYTLVTRQDADAMFAYLQAQTPVQQINSPHRLRFPYNQRYLLAWWRALFFTPAIFKEDHAQTAMWNRGAYLSLGLGHCSACHSSRNLFGANSGYMDLSGGDMPGIFWYAPSLLSSRESHLAKWSGTEVRALLQNGISSKNAVLGPMAEVVSNSLQYLNSNDIEAMQVYLQALPVDPIEKADSLDQLLAASNVDSFSLQAAMQQGKSLYTTHCANCHGESGEGVNSVYPALKDNTAILLPQVGNLIRVTLAGGFAPTTKGNPRPYGMPPFAPVLSDGEVALILTYVRNAWGNRATPVNSSDVNHYRTAPLD